ncbi:MAG: hypothetical protein LBN34_03715 [Clostridiales Family XIII bacterium]|nr:hypothetical protein [Clostridiales Family XIII bacterium]
MRIWGRGRKSILACSLVAILLLGVTFALLTALTEKKTNVFTFADVEVGILEPTGVSWTSKQVQLQNVNGANAIPGVVRAMIVPVLKDASGDGLQGEYAPLGKPGTNGVLQMGDFVFTFTNGWETDWFFYDGYFYYKKVLDPGEKTTMLLQSVTLKDQALAAEYKDIEVDVDVLSDILQASDGVPQANWGVHVSGKVVSPP